MLGENLTLGVQKSDYTVSLLVDSESHSCAITSLTNSQLQCTPDQSLLELFTQSSQSVNSELTVSTKLLQRYIYHLDHTRTMIAVFTQTNQELLLSWLISANIYFCSTCIWSDAKRMIKICTQSKSFITRQAPYLCYIFLLFQYTIHVVISI